MRNMSYGVTISKIDAIKGLRTVQYIDLDLSKKVYK